MIEKNTLRKIGIVLVIIITLLIFWFSSKSGSVSMRQSDNLLLKMKIISEYDIIAETPLYSCSTFLIRKGAHFLIYMILGAGAALVMEEDSGKIIALIILLAVFDELHQSFNGRGASLSDVLLDMGGGFTGWSLIEILKHCLKKIEKS